MTQDPGSFNPYHKWLGISKEITEPDHYMLLGITEFEADIDVISTAADARMMLLRTFQTGKYSALSQQLLNEVSAARVCLLNADKKAEYDEQLRARHANATQDGALASIASEFVTPPPPPMEEFKPPKNVAPPPAPDGEGISLFSESDTASSRSSIGRSSSISKRGKNAAGASRISRGGSKAYGSTDTSSEKNGARSTAKNSGKTGARHEDDGKKKKTFPVVPVVIGVVIAFLVIGFLAFQASNKGDAEKLYKSARKALEVENFDAAARDIKKAIRADKQKKYEDLLAEIQSQQEQKKTAEISYHLALDHERAKNWDLAREEILRALGMYPNNGEYISAKNRIFATSDAIAAEKARKEEHKKGEDSPASTVPSTEQLEDSEQGFASMEEVDYVAPVVLPVPEGHWLDTEVKKFNGTSDTVGLGDPENLNFSGNITMAAWIKPSKDKAESMPMSTILVHGYSEDPSAELSFRLLHEKGEYQVGTWGKDTEQRYAAAPISPDDWENWVHLAGVYDGTAWRLYRNGVEIASKPDNVGVFPLKADWHIGSTLGKERFFKGEIKQVAIWKEALAPDQIASLCNTSESRRVSRGVRMGGVLASDFPRPLGHWLQTPRSFNGSSDTEKLGNPPEMNIVGEITMAAWVKLAKKTRDMRSILSHGYSTDPPSDVYLRTGDGETFRVGAWTGGDNNYFTLENMQDADVGHWVHVVGTYKDGAWHIYRNGKQESTTPSDVGAVAVNTDWHIGSTNGKQRFFEGELSNVMLWNIGLTEDQVSALYASQGGSSDEKAEDWIPLSSSIAVGGKELGDLDNNQVRKSEQAELQAGDKIVKTADGVEYAFRWCPPGEFTQGKRGSQKEIEAGFWMLESEVTQAMWEKVMGENPSQTFVGENLPVNCVSWDECRGFCKKLSKTLDLPISLPTEVQWEYACRAGTKTPYNYGRKPSADRMSPASVESPVMTPAGTFPANNWGFFNMHDNVGEWCLDNETDRRPVRGTGKGFGDQCGNAFDRTMDEPTTKGELNGFRIVINPDE